MTTFYQGKEKNFCIEVQDICTTYTDSISDAMYIIQMFASPFRKIDLIDCSTGEVLMSIKDGEIKSSIFDIKID